jgi:YHS domain-containing protein
LIDKAGMKQLRFTSAKYVFALVLAFTLMNFTAQAQTSVKGDKKLYNISDDHLAIKGYDPVAYFEDNTAKEGKEDVSYAYEGVTYRFASHQHLQSFKSDPERYKPQYGGWCAYAMGATGEKVDIDPETFKVLNGKLYLFYNRFFNNTKKSWDKDEANLKRKADTNWQKIAR